MTAERIKMPFGNQSVLDKTPKVSVALNPERRDKAATAIRCQTIKPLTCLWDFEGTVRWPLIPAYFPPAAWQPFPCIRSYKACRNSARKHRWEDSVSQRSTRHWHDSPAWGGSETTLGRPSSPSQRDIAELWSCRGLRVQPWQWCSGMLLPGKKMTQNITAVHQEWFIQLSWQGVMQSSVWLRPST